MAVDKREMGRKLYVHTRQGGHQNNNACVIDSHGGLPLGEPSFTVPSGITLYFYVDAGDVQSFETKQIVSQEKFTMCSYTTDLQGIMTGKFEPAEVMKPQSKCPNYLLMKIQSSSHTGALGAISNKFGARNQMNYDGIEAMMDNWAGMDVVTVRNRWPTGQIMLSEAINQIKSSGFGYSEIHCSFCRWKMSPRGAKKMSAVFPMPKISRA